MILVPGSLHVCLYLELGPNNAPWSAHQLFGKKKKKKFSPAIRSKIMTKKNNLHFSPVLFLPTQGVLTGQHRTKCLALAGIFSAVMVNFVNVVFSLGEI